MVGFALGGLGFVQAGLLGGEVAFEFDAFAGTVLGGVAGHKALVGQGLEVLLALAGQGQGGFQFGDHGAHGGGFRQAPLLFSREARQPGGDVAPFGGQLGLGVSGVFGGPVRRQVFGVQIRGQRLPGARMSLWI